jgi:hypothetical protein
MSISTQKSSVIKSALVAVSVAAVGLIGWFVWQGNHKIEPQADVTHQQVQGEKQKQEGGDSSDLTEDGKYLVIKEWNVRSILPVELQAQVTYSLGEITPDPDGNQIQAAKILLKHDLAAGDDCASVETSEGSFFEAGAQLLRAEKDKPFDTKRYRWTFKANLMSDDRHTYHLSYVTPSCVGDATASRIERLQTALEHLQVLAN